MSYVNDDLAVFLGQVSFFSEVSKSSLSHLCDNLRIENYSRRDSIIDKGDVGDAMYVILDGEVEVFEANHVFGMLKNGECFGEYALIDDETRSASVRAVSETKVAKIERKLFLDLMKGDTGFAQGILAVMIKRHRLLDKTQEQRARSKKELEEANGKMSGLSKGAMDSIIMFNTKFRIILTNPSANNMLENDDLLQRNILYFFDDRGGDLIESLVKSEMIGNNKSWHKYLPQTVKVIGSNETETVNEGTLSKYGKGEGALFTLILRNIEQRLIAEDETSRLTKQTEYLEREIEELTNNYGIIAQDESMVSVLNLIGQVAHTDATVLVNGETGTGKELVARAVHAASPRNDKPLVRVNCGAIPTNLIESELFGHEKGAFTGATASRKGRFLLADNGTIFLDEIGELPLELQPKLLRVLQEGEFDPVGSSQTIKVNVRIIAATHRDLLTFSKKGKFREDLYYRLNVFPITVPPLRERGEDIHLIAQAIIDRLSSKLNKQIRPLSTQDKEVLTDYNWPGNVRELQNIIERAVIVSRDGSIPWKLVLPRNLEQDTTIAEVHSEKIFTVDEMATLEKQNILRALKKTGWKISGQGGAASLLQIKPTTLASRIKALQIVRPI